MNRKSEEKKRFSIVRIGDEGCWRPAAVAGDWTDPTLRRGESKAETALETIERQQRQTKHEQTDATKVEFASNCRHARTWSECVEGK